MVVVVAAVGLGVGAGSALAHSSLVSSTPAVDAALDKQPTSIELVFNQDISEQFAQVALTDSAGEQLQLSEVAVSGPTVTTPIVSSVPAGRYTIGYRVVSADGHPITGEVAFSVLSTGLTSAPVPTGAPAAVNPAGPGEGAVGPSVSATQPPQATDTATGSKLEDNWIVVVLLGGVLLGLIVIGALLVFNSGKDRGDDENS
ncbi:copper resistance CopC family protein [Williamsia sp.]|uniref:copper resistance CopC family protein n=1 Tax=Williamsia sp. TaxID=1872085 RepID=UPI002F920230